MNSIKNAIVTVTLLAVGYGSYIVLSEPQAGPNPSAANTAGVGNANSEELPALEIDQHATTPPPLAAGLTTPPSDAVSLPPANTSQFELSPPKFASSEPSPNDARDAAVANSRMTESNASSLPPLPELMSAPTSSSGFANGPPQSKTYRDLAVENPPQLDLEPPRAAAESKFAPLQPLPGLAVEPSAEAPIEPAVSGPDGRAPLPLPESPANPVAIPNPLDKAPTKLVGPNDIDALPVAPAEKVTAILPPIDPSVGPIPPAPNEGSVAFEKVWSEVQELVRNQDSAKALRTLTPWSIDASLSGDQQARCFRLLDELAAIVIYSRASYLEPVYTVRAGETLDEISAAHGVPQELLAKINGVTAPYALSTGESLKVVRGPFRAEVSITNNRLTLYAGAYYAGRFEIAIGRDLPPEEAFYEVAEKSLGRNYFDRRSGSEVLRGQANNRYGDHWIGLRGEHITTGHSVGIHGRARQKESASQDLGCVSLDAIDASDVYSILSVGSRVQVRR